MPSERREEKQALRKQRKARQSEKSRRKAQWREKNGPMKNVLVLGICKHTGKKQFTRADAEKLAEEMMSRGDKFVVNYYKCWCKHWHVGHGSENGQKIRRET